MFKRAVVFVILIMILSPILYGNASARNIYYSDFSDIVFERYADVPIAATGPDMKTGMIGWARIGVLPGNNNIVIDERTTVDLAAVEAIVSAVRFAESRYMDDVDYYISYDLRSDSVSGHSSGLAIALGLVSILEEREIRKDVVASAEIDENGDLHEVGGIHLKALAAAAGGFTSMIIPPGQSKMQAYERHVSGNTEYYLVKTVDLAEYMHDKYDVQIIEAKNAADIIDIYFAKQKI